MLSDGVCACNRQERTHTLGDFGDSGAGAGGRLRTARGFLLMLQTEVSIEFLMKWM